MSAGGEPNSLGRPKRVSFVNATILEPFGIAPQVHSDSETGPYVHLAPHMRLAVSVC